jgi:peptide methionine sulfoxide reductase MsrB
MTLQDRMSHVGHVFLGENGDSAAQRHLVRCLHEAVLVEGDTCTLWEDES